MAWYGVRRGELWAYATAIAACSGLRGTSAGTLSVPPRHPRPPRPHLPIDRGIPRGLCRPGSYGATVVEDLAIIDASTYSRRRAQS